MIDQPLKDRVAVVTGAATGIGAATAVALARAGAAVCIAHLPAQQAAAADVLARAYPDGGGMTHAVDVTDEAAVEALFGAVAERLGSPRVLVNSAGIDALGKNVADLSLAEWDAALRTNLTGPFLCARAFVRTRRGAGGGGKIVNVGSVHEEIPRAGAAEYCASKGGLRNLTRALSLEVASMRIGVVQVAPGMVLTPMNQADIDDPHKRAEDEATIPWKRGAQPEEVANLIVYLVRDEAEYITGASVVIDGALMQNTGQGA